MQRCGRQVLTYQMRCIFKLKYSSVDVAAQSLGEHSSSPSGCCSCWTRAKHLPDFSHNKTRIHAAWTCSGSTSAPLQIPNLTVKINEMPGKHIITYFISLLPEFLIWKNWVYFYIYFALKSPLSSHLQNLLRWNVSLISMISLKQRGIEKNVV